MRALQYGWRVLVAYLAASFVATLFLAIITKFVYATGVDNSPYAMLLFAPINPYFMAMDLKGGHALSAHWDFFIPFVISFALCLAWIFHRSPVRPAKDSLAS